MGDIKMCLFLGTSLVSRCCKNPRKPYRPPDSNYWRDDKDIQAN